MTLCSLGKNVDFGTNAARQLIKLSVCHFCSKHNDRKFIDWKKVIVKAGDGGNGLTHFKRLRFQPKGGPDGGDGGRGGSVILSADSSLQELAHVKKHLKAENGGSGGIDNRHGKNASDLIVKVPLGTIATHNKEVIADISEEGESCVIAQGGEGGLGNATFKTATDQAPEKSSQGTPGQERVIELELKTIADVGLVGFPNAGKSTLLRAISRATPTVAAYPFTTLNPSVGMVEYDDFSQIAVADIPGLIPDAHLNKGLGHTFLRHIERCCSLLYVLDISQKDFHSQFISLQRELELYKKGLSSRPAAIVANKIDLADSIDVSCLEREFDLPVMAVSGKYGNGIPALKRAIHLLLESSKWAL
ncbi:GTPase Obg isoform X1 [Nematostella vectensis]|uniref:GTPase Obg isoform X1 n=1 Tax=Nematostella vectensis TaxID=45351 RepID=UPI0020774260|nr:GTPase Obg isoform X1 [Nematostella vectensis]